jgi:hypothetical protein
MRNADDPWRATQPNGCQTPIACPKTGTGTLLQGACPGFGIGSRAGERRRPLQAITSRQSPAADHLSRLAAKLSWQTRVPAPPQNPRFAASTAQPRAQTVVRAVLRLHQGKILRSLVQQSRRAGEKTQKTRQRPGFVQAGSNAAIPACSRPLSHHARASRKKTPTADCAAKPWRSGDGSRARRVFGDEPTPTWHRNRSETHERLDTLRRGSRTVRGRRPSEKGCN